MIPLSLRLRNFMSYGEQAGQLDFNTFHVACLCGDNGHGKSALLDAITWALWGRSRAKSEDDLIQLGKQEMEVEFEFALGAERYCVLRKRQMRPSGKRRISVPILELQVFDGEGYRPLSGDSVTQTQAQIQRLLRIDYETFINSAFIVQGRANEFTLKTPQERKTVLADLLGLERYDELVERAREESRRCQAERAALQVEIGRIDAELAKRGEYEALLLEATRAIELAEEQRQKADADLTKWRLEKTKLEAHEGELAELRRRRAELEGEIGRLDVDLAEQKKLVTRLEEALARGNEARQAAARLKQLREKEATLGRAAVLVIGLGNRRSELEATIATTRETLTGQLAALRTEVERLQGLSARSDTLAKDVEAAEAQLAELARFENEREAKRRCLQGLEVEARTLRETNARLKDEMNDLREKLNELEAAKAVCPLCGGKLTPESREAARARLTADGKVRGDAYRKNERRVGAIEAERKETELALVDFEKRLAGRAALEQRLATVKLQHAEAWSAQGAVISKLEDAARLDTQIQRREFLVEEHKELAKVVRDIERTGYDPLAHETLRKEIGRLEGAEALLAEVETAQASIERERGRLKDVQAQLAARRQSLEEGAARLTELEEVAAKREEVERELARASAALDGAIEVRSRAHEALGTARQRIEHLQQAEGQRAERQKEAARAAEEKVIYDELARAFGKDGIQAMIIESVIPEIEAEANELLQRLTDGQLNLAIRTQRELRTGGGTVETLDIQIADAFGTRSYEMYSGGEAFRIDFAIRIALSKLLARRAGTQLQLLVIDEGFGSQDATGRDRLVEAISAVASDFEKIVVVTHIQELKDAFPYRIDVVKGPEGSTIAAVTAAA